MSETTKHPTDQQLVDFMTAALTREQFDYTINHINQCLVCKDRLWVIYKNMQEKVKETRLVKASKILMDSLAEMFKARTGARLAIFDLRQVLEKVNQVAEVDAITIENCGMDPDSHELHCKHCLRALINGLATFPAPEGFAPAIRRLTVFLRKHYDKLPSTEAPCNLKDQPDDEADDQSFTIGGLMEKVKNFPDNEELTFKKLGVDEAHHVLSCADCLRDIINTIDRAKDVPQDEWGALIRISKLMQDRLDTLEASASKSE